MPKLPGLSQKDAVRGLERAGFKIIRQGKHIVLSNGTRTVTVLRHNVINAYTMGPIARETGYTPQEFRNLL